MRVITRRQTLKGGLALGAVASGVIRSTAGAEPQTSPLTLWYRQPAEAWTEALPIGNGRLGAMIFGGIARERLQLNEDTLYAGGPYDPSNPDALAALPRVRALIAEGKYRRRAESGRGKDDGAADPHAVVPDRGRSDSELRHFGVCRRTIGATSISTAACARVRFVREGVTFTRESFASAVDQVIVTRISADRPGALEFPRGLRNADARRRRDRRRPPGAQRPQRRAGGHRRQSCASRLACAVIPQGGTLELRDGEFVVTGADSALVLVAIATNFRRFDDVSGDPESTTRAQIKAAAAKDVRRAARGARRGPSEAVPPRVRSTCRRHRPARSPTNARIRNSQTSDDPQLAALYFQYARYLLHRLLAPGHAAREPAGPVERQAVGALGLEVHHQHQHRDELLARGAGESRRVRAAAGGDGEGSRGHRRGAPRESTTARAAGWRTTTPICGAPPARSTARSGACGPPAAPGCASTCGITTTTAATAPISPTSIHC